MIITGTFLQRYTPNLTVEETVQNTSENGILV